VIIIISAAIVLAFLTFGYSLIESSFGIVSLYRHYFSLQQRIMINVGNELLYVVVSILLSFLFHPSYYYQIRGETVLTHAYHAIFKNEITQPDWLIVSYPKESIARHIAILS
jgi:hypothetical protein